MIYFGLTENHDIGALRAEIENLRPHELFAFYCASAMTLYANMTSIRKAIGRSDRVVITFPESAADDPAVFKLIHELEGLFAVSFTQKLTQGLKVEHTGQMQSGDDAVIAKFREFKSKLVGKTRLIPEIAVDGDLSFLGPTLHAMVAPETPWCVLAVTSKPDLKRSKALRNCFQYLQMRRFPLIDIHFSFDCVDRRSWKIRSHNLFEGPEEAHIDISNKCTHSCEFCALYAPGAIEDHRRRAGGTLSAEIRSYMSDQIPFERAKGILESLPVTTLGVQFGGAGDPLTHPHAIDLIELARNGGFRTEVLSNMEYPSEQDLERLTRLGGKKSQLHFIVNLSAATAATYVRTRPRQTENTFRKVISNLTKLRDLREKNGGIGAAITLMCVTNRLNFHEASQYVQLGAELQADAVWLKPMEIHHPLHYQLLPEAQVQRDYAKSMRSALETADRLAVRVFDRAVMEAIVKAEA